MKRVLCCIVLLLFLSPLPAENQTVSNPENKNLSGNEQQKVAENGKKLFFTQLKFGLGVDFEGMQGRPPLDNLNTAAMRNQLGATIGLDFGWSVFRKTAGKGAGDFCLGFGFDFQYWAPTTYMSRDNYDQRYEWWWWDGRYDGLDYMYLHYMRVPVTLNAAYEFKVNAGTLRRTGLWFSLGANNNFFFLKYHSDDKETLERVKRSFDEKSHWKISGTWLLGLNMVFENNWIFKVSIGGDFGQKMIRSHLFFKYYEEYDRGRFGRLFYGHHEFLMFETGYRFVFGE